MKLKAFVLALALCALSLTPACALEYAVDAPEDYLFAHPTSQEAVYEPNSSNADRSKNTALIPPGFGTPTSYLPGSGEALTPNLLPGTLGGGLVTTAGAVNVGTMNTETNFTAIPGITTGTVPVASTSVQTTRFTDVTPDLYYSGGYLGTLKIPRLGVNVKVYQGTDSSALAKGAGHFPDTSIWDGNVAIAGHNRGTNCCFGNIHTLKTGDTITLTTRLGARTYTVASVRKISETDRSMLEATPEDCVTLFTCVRDQSAYRWCVRAVA